MRSRSRWGCFASATNAGEMYPFPYLSGGHLMLTANQCAACILLSQRTCASCGGGYCVAHAEGSSSILVGLKHSMCKLTTYKQSNQVPYSATGVILHVARGVNCIDLSISSCHQRVRALSGAING